MSEPQNILILGSVWPEPNSSAAGTRMLQLMQIFLSKGWRVTFGSAAADSAYSVDLQKIKVNKAKVELNNSDFDVFVRNLNPSIVVFDRFMVEEQFGWRVAEQCPDALRILDTEDLHCLRRARQKAFKESRQFHENELLSTDVARREIASILRSDLSLIISAYELELLKKQFKVEESLLLYLPFMLDKLEEPAIQSWLPYTSRQNFTTIGNFLHEPNCDSVLFLKEEIWPLVRKALPKAEIHIYGAYPVPRIIQLHNSKEGFLIKGRAGNAMEVMEKARVCLAPLRFGAGLKGKLLEAMLCGTPSVTTAIGAEAMHDNFEWNGAIATTAEEIAKAAIKLYTDESAWHAAQANGVQIVNHCFNKDQYASGFINKINELKADLILHRRNNFIGAMLLHHTMASTKFMSRWIEAKNRN
jgi:O-antigen biosynthesis protein